MQRLFHDNPDIYIRLFDLPYFDDFIDKIRESESLINILLCCGLSENLVKAIYLLSVSPRFIDNPILAISFSHYNNLRNLVVPLNLEPLCVVPLIAFMFQEWPDPYSNFNPRAASIAASTDPCY